MINLSVVIKISRFILIVLTILLSSCFEPVKEKGTNETTKKGKITPPLFEFSSLIKAHSNSIGNQGSAFLYANTGLYLEAMQSFDNDFPETPENVFYDSSSFDFLPAIDYIIEQAKDHRIVIINEAHHIAHHRFFANLLLPRLRKLGFNYFGGETLNMDSLMLNRGYPALYNGSFSQEAQYGNMIRNAMDCGFKVFAYEADSGKNGMQREIEQARNIERILKKDSTSRMLIYCGYAHADEGKIEGWERSMAGRLTEYTGIDPLTIDQVELTEHSDTKHENPYYRKMHFKDYVVPVNKGKVFGRNFLSEGTHCDLFVYHPRTQRIHNRPDWLFRVYHPVIINDKITISYPVMVKVYYLNENERQAVPVDVIEIENDSISTALALLPNKNYRIYIQNEVGDKQEILLDLKGTKAIFHE